MGVIEDLLGDFARDKRVGLFLDLNVRRRRPFSFIRLLHGGCKQKWSSFARAGDVLRSNNAQILLQAVQCVGETAVRTEPSAATTQRSERCFIIGRLLQVPRAVRHNGARQGVLWRRIKSFPKAEMTTVHVKSNYKFVIGSRPWHFGLKM